jgi:hypothetical protein
LSINNLFKIRKLNKALKKFSDSFSGFSEKEIDQDLKEFYEKEMQNNRINVKLIFPLKGNPRYNLKSQKMNLFVNINTF